MNRIQNSVKIPEHEPFDEEDCIRDCGVEIAEEVGSPAGNEVGEKP